MNKIVCAFFAIVLLAAACGEAVDGATVDGGDTTTVAGEAAETTTTTQRPTTTTTQPEDESSPATQPGDNTVPATDDKVDIAIADLAERIGVDPATIVVQSVDRVTWRDGSIGCPDPDLSYTQALVEGLRIILEVDGTAYHYHSGRDADPFYCADPAEPLGGAAGGL